MYVCVCVCVCVCERERERERERDRLSLCISRLRKHFGAGVDTATLQCGSRYDDEHGNCLANCIIKNK
jgi:hypothetical protein